MAPFTTQGSGNWNSTVPNAPWLLGIVPGNGDTVDVAAAHTLTISTNLVWGAQPADATTFDLTVHGLLVVASGVTATIKTNIKVIGSAFAGVRDYVKVNGILEIDPSPGITYVIQLGTSHFEETRLKVQGVAGTYAEVRAAAGQKIEINRGGFIDTGHFLFQYAKFSRVSDASNYFSVSTPSSVGVSCTSTLFVACGDFYADGGADPGMARTWNGCSWSSSTGTQNLRYFGTTNGIVNTCVFDKTPVIIGLDTMVTMPTGNFFKELLGNTNTVKAGVMKGNLFRQTTGGGYNAQGDIGDVAGGNYFLTDADIFNPHWIEMCADNAGSDKTSRNNVFDHNGSSVAGDTHSFSTGVAADKTFTIKNNIALPSGLNGTSECGTGCSLLGNLHVTVVLEHNTYYMSDQGCATIGETYAGYIGIVSSFKSNLIWSKVGAPSPLKTNTSVPGAVEDAVSAADADYNAGLNLAAGTELKGYSSPMSGTPGAHDVLLAADPFVASTRNMKTWDLALGGAGTYANAVAELAKINDASGYNSAYNIADLLTWVRNGFVVNTLSLKDAGADGVTIGAMAFVPAAPVATAATSVSDTGFTATWNAAPGATDYRLDVSADNFATLLPGYANLVVGGLSQAVIGLSASTSYKYRVRAANSVGTVSPNSNTITQVTNAAPSSGIIPSSSMDLGMSLSI